MFEFKLPDLGEGIAEGEILKWHVTEGGDVVEDAPLVDVETDKAAVTIPVIASGGVGNLQHLADGVTEGRADAVLAASIFHFGEYTVRQAKEYMRDRGIEVRL